MKRVVLVVTLCMTAACESSAGAEGMDRSEFVSTSVALRRATVAGELDGTMRDSILEAHGTTEAELRDYIEQRADDPEAIADTWREIMDSIAARDSLTADNDSTS